jgi:hypothetical protein
LPIGIDAAQLRREVARSNLSERTKETILAILDAAGNALGDA